MMKVLNYMLAALFCSYIVIFTWVICVTPAYLFVGYARVVDEASMYLAKKAAVREAVAIAASAGGAARTTSLALRLVTAGTGWLGLGIMLGLTALDIYYTYQNIRDLNQAAGSATWSVGNSTDIEHINIRGTDNQKVYDTATTSESTISGYCSGGTSGYDQAIGPFDSAACIGGCARLYDADATALGISTTYTAGRPIGGGAFNGWWVMYTTTMPNASTHYSAYNFAIALCHPKALTTNKATQTTQSPTSTQVQNWFDANPTHTLNPDNRLNPVGMGKSPHTADEVQTINVSDIEVTTTLKSADQIASTDIVLGDGFQAPQGTESTQTETQTLTSTKTETVTQNPDGSTTTQTQESNTSTATCSAGSHIQKTTGTVIQEHIDKWQQSGLIAALSGLKNIVWSSSLPTITFTSARWGSHSINMNDWAWVFASVKVVMIAGATLVSYRLVFG